MQTHTQTASGAHIVTLRPQSLAVSASKMKFALGVAINLAERQINRLSDTRHLTERLALQRKTRRLNELRNRCEEVFRHDARARLTISPEDYDLVRDLGYNPFPENIT